jgi:uncharacterized membrane protein YfcA
MIVLAGALGEFVDAAAGMGFGVLSSSVMIAAGVPPGAASTTVNLAKVGSGAFSAVSHWRFKNVQWKWFLSLVVTGVAGAVVGGLLVAHLPRGFIRVAVPFALLGMGLLILRRGVFPAAIVGRASGGSTEAMAHAELPPIAAAWAATIESARRRTLEFAGFVAGLMNAMTGGYGPFATSAVILVKASQPPRFVVGTVSASEVFVAAASSAALLSTVASEGFRWQWAVALMGGTVLTAPLGAYLSKRLPARGLLVAVSITLIAINAWSIAKALA